MNRQDYLEALGAALSGKIPDRDRLNALRYYKEYFEAEGPEGERELIHKLGRPEELAAKIIREYGSAPGQDGEERSGPKRRRPKWLAPVLACVGALLIAGIAIGAGRFTGGLVRNVIRITVSEVKELPDRSQTPDAPPVIDADVSAGFPAVEVDIGMGDVTVQTGEGYDVAIDVGSGGTGYMIQYELRDDGTLRIYSTPKSGLSGWDFGEKLGAKVVVTVPEDCMLSEISIEVGVGSVRLDGLSGGRFEGSTGVGEVSACDLGRVNELSLETSIGDVVMESVPAFDTELKTGMGSIEVAARCAESACNYELESGFGKITVGGQKHSSGKVERENGGEYTLEAETGMGEIEVSFP